MLLALYPPKPLRLFFPLLFLLLLSSSGRATDLRDRLLLLFPEGDSAAVAERNYLEKQLTNLFGQLRYTDDLGKKRPDNQLAGIRSRLRRTLFLFHNADATPGDAFRRGLYNDATAALLHALVLDHFHLPYSAYVDHWECLLVAEASSPPLPLAAPGSLRHSPEAERDYRREYLNLVREAVTDPLTGLSVAAADSVFYRYYYSPTRPLAFPDLVAYYHYRRAERSYRYGNYRRCRGRLSRASALTEHPAFTILDQAARIQLTALKHADPRLIEDRLFELWRSSPANAYYPAELLQRFDRRQRVALRTGGPQAAADLLRDFRNRAPSGQGGWARQLQQLQGLRLIAHYQEDGKLIPALHLAEALLRNEPENETLQQFVAELLLTHLRRSHADPDELLRHTEAAAVRYPFLRRSDRYADIILREAALEVRDLFAAGDLAPAREALLRFRRTLAEVPKGRDRRLWTLTAFIAASNYYFQAEDYAPARAYVDEALRHDPTNDFLLHQQDLLSRY